MTFSLNTACIIYNNIKNQPHTILIHSHHDGKKKKLSFSRLQLFWSNLEILDAVLILSSALLLTLHFPVPTVIRSVVNRKTVLIQGGNRPEDRRVRKES